MHAVDTDKPGLTVVNTFAKLLSTLLDEASTVKPASTIEPALIKSDFVDLKARVDAALPQQEDGDANGAAPPSESLKTRRFAIVEGASRDLFGHLIASIPIDSPDFVRMWNLLDILSMLSDSSQCDPALVFWLVEELLDSQTIAGCRRIFDFLESRRERITAKNFSQKKLVILRSCNELLRRLSRAEDTAFCGRVFIFMFQCFPLGDRSSVNLRGEYHVENVTAYEKSIGQDASSSNMDLDAESLVTETNGQGKQATQTTGAKAKESRSRLSSEELYPLVWSLQESFSQPVTLFDPVKFSHFKRSLEETMRAFESLHAEGQASLKRKRTDEGATAVSEAFNPKYLTSPDLFELEISDLSFRRHVLVQALIITEFLLSLSAEAKRKLSTLPAPNKAVVYTDQLSEENTKWATDIKSRISEYLKMGADGPYFYRMVETVLARDKNWVFWKMASCPPIEREPVTPSDFMEAKNSAARMATSKRLRQTPIGAVSMEFLNKRAGDAASGDDDDDGGGGMSELRPPERYQLPKLESFKRPIADDDFEIDMPTSDETKAAAIYGKSSKIWRALRIAGRSRLAAFDKIDDPKAIGVVFEEPMEVTSGDDDADGSGQGAVAAEGDMPSDKTAVVIAGPDAEARDAVVSKLLEDHAGVFALVVRHTTRSAAEGEVRGKTFHFVSSRDFNQLRDGDGLIEHGQRDGSDYGTSTKAIDAVIQTGKIPVLQLDVEAAQFAKDMDFEARYILVDPSPAAQGTTTDTMAEMYDFVVDVTAAAAAGADNDNDTAAAAAADAVSAFIYGHDSTELEKTKPVGDDDVEQVADQDQDRGDNVNGNGNGDAGMLDA